MFFTVLIAGICVFAVYYGIQRAEVGVVNYIVDIWYKYEKAGIQIDRELSTSFIFCSDCWAKYTVL